MDFGTLVYAELNPLERRTPGALKHHIRWVSVDNLRFHAQHELPLLVNVSSASTESDHVVYTCTVSSVTSKKTWSVSYRYSEFVDFRTKLEELWTCHEPNCSGSCQALRNIVATIFPKKRLPVLSMNLGTISSRKPASPKQCL
jgi:hypothetical protein